MATLTIDFTAPTPVPVNGFSVKYRKIGTSTYSTVYPNPTTSPILITVPAGESYEGVIKSDCGNASSSPETNFLAYGSVQIYAPYGSNTTTVCSGGVPPQLFISNAYSDISSGVSVYTNQQLTTLLTGPSYILNSLGVIYNISGGVVGSSTNTVCGI